MRSWCRWQSSGRSLIGVAARAAAAGAALAVCLALAACGREPTRAPFDGPIVLVTIEALPAAITGLASETSETSETSEASAGSATPALDAFAATATWRGPALAASSWEAPSLATILTGLLPHQHGLRRYTDQAPDPSFTTLAAALRRCGYRTTAFSNSTSLRGDGWFRGADELLAVGQLDVAIARLERPETPRRFTWLHLGRAQPPWRNESGADDGLPAKLGWADLATLDAARLPAARARHAAAVAAADRQFAAILDALRRGGQLARGVVVVAGTHGVALGDQGARGYGTALERAQLEVPLIIHLPDALRRLVPAERWPTLAGLTPWLAALTGAVLPPAAARAFGAGAPRFAELELPGGELSISRVAVRGDTATQELLTCPADGACSPLRVLRWAASSAETTSTGETPVAGEPLEGLVERWRSSRPADWPMSRAEAAATNASEPAGGGVSPSGR